jgi:hypothetical protein
MGVGAPIASLAANARVAARRPIVYPADTDFHWSFPDG